LSKIVDRLLHKRLLIGLTSIGNNDGDEIDANEGTIESDKDEAVDDEDESITDEEGIVDDGEEIVASEGVVAD
jgi:hypothetical protein